jgi:dimeric dUTPase (all-alpha-NTP-PPase superfamily)
MDFTEHENFEQSIDDNRIVVAFEAMGKKDHATAVRDLMASVQMSPATRSVSKEEAVEIITFILHKDMAYRYEVKDKDEALRLAQQFLAFFRDTVTCCTNASFSRVNGEITSLSGWNSCTSATFDCGVVCSDGKVVGLIWAQDED